MKKEEEEEEVFRKKFQLLKSEVYSQIGFMCTKDFFFVNWSIYPCYSIDFR